MEKCRSGKKVQRPKPLWPPRVLRPCFSYNGIGDAGAKALAKVLNCNTILEELELSHTKIGSVGAEALAKAIGLNIALKKLDLSKNYVCYIGAKALAEVLNCNTILEELDLSCNEIGSVGTEALAQAVVSNTALKKLDFTVNDVGDVGAIALAQALHSNSSLEVLELLENCIGDSGAKAFAEALHHNSTLTHLDLSYNGDIGEEGVHHLIQALTVNDSISENGLTLDRERYGSCAHNCSGYKNEMVVLVRVHYNISIRSNSHSSCPQDKESYKSQNINRLAFEDVERYNKFCSCKF